MNAALKTKWANVLTAIATAIAVMQTFLTSPPFTAETILIVSTILTYLALLATTWKQFLSPEVSNAGGNITLAAAIIASIVGAADLFNVIHLNENTGKYVRWGITVAAALISILSKQIFPSKLQKEKMHELKNSY